MADKPDELLVNRCAVGKDRHLGKQTRLVELALGQLRDALMELIAILGDNQRRALGDLIPDRLNLRGLVKDIALHAFAFLRTHGDEHIKRAIKRLAKELTHNVLILRALLDAHHVRQAHVLAQGHVILTTDRFRQLAKRFFVC